MKEQIRPACAGCPVEKYKRACDSDGGAGPRGCPTIEGRAIVEEAMAAYADGATREFARKASLQEAAGYASRESRPRADKTRLEEIIDFARRLGCRRLGLAFCAGLIAEAAALDEILRAQGFEVVSVVCKVGATPKESLGLSDDEKIRPGRFESICNPIAQAMFLNHAGAELNIMMGLCVGHDALFLKHAEAYTTVLAAKDRVLGHNPLAALYTSGSYYSRLKSRI